MDELEKRLLLGKLQPSEIQRTLVQAGLYLAAFELLRYDVVENTKSFFLEGFDERGLTYSPEYTQKVLPLDIHVFDASARWLVTVGAIKPAEAEELIDIRRHRNQIAHELPTILVDPATHLSPALLERCRYFVGLLGRFWGGIEADTNPDFDGVEVDYGGIKSGSALLMDHIWECVHGPASAP